MFPWTFICAFSFWFPNLVWMSWNKLQSKDKSIRKWNYLSIITLIWELQFFLSIFSFFFVFFNTFWLISYSISISIFISKLAAILNRNLVCLDSEPLPEACQNKNEKQKKTEPINRQPFFDQFDGNDAFSCSWPKFKSARGCIKKSILPELNWVTKTRKLFHISDSGTHIYIRTCTYICTYICMKVYILYTVLCDACYLNFFLCCCKALFYIGK